MDDVIFTSVAFGQQYLEQQKRLEASIREIYPEANMLFFAGRLPDTSRPFEDSLYGFKPHAILEASQRFKKVVWLDPAMILTGPIDRLLDHSIVAVRDESSLADCFADKYFNLTTSVTREDFRKYKVHLVGGSLYYFDFTQDMAKNVFQMWYDMERSGWFGSQQEQASEQINSHRNDESCMALSMYLHGVQPVTPEEVGYCVEENQMWAKRHFK